MKRFNKIILFFIKFDFLFSNLFLFVIVMKYHWLKLVLFFVLCEEKESGNKLVVYINCLTYDGRYTKNSK